MTGTPYIKDSWPYTPPTMWPDTPIRFLHARHADALRAAAYHRSWATPGSPYFTPANRIDGLWHAKRDLRDAAAWRAEIDRRTNSARDRLAEAAE